MQSSPPTIGIVILFGIVLLAILLFVGFVALLMKNGSNALVAVLVAFLGLGLLGGAVMFLSLVGVKRVAYTEEALRAEASASSLERELISLPPRIVIDPPVAPKPPSINAGDGISAEVSEEGEVGDWDAVDANIAELPDPEKSNTKVIQRGEINLSTLPDGYPEWIDQRSGEWNEHDKTWTKTILIGPYEDRNECVGNFPRELRQAVTDYANFRKARLAEKDPDIGDVPLEDLPVANVDLNRGIQGRSTSSKGYELREYRRGALKKAYLTEVNVESFEEPWHAVFARITFDERFQNQVDQRIVHGRSVKKAFHLAGIWGVSLLGMGVLLGGLKMAGAGAAPVAVKASSLSLADTQVSAKKEPLVSAASPSTSTAKGQVVPVGLRFKLLLAPIICTAIFMMTNDGRFNANEFWPSYPAEFWPKWVWFGCGIAYVMTFLPSSKKKRK